MTGNITAEELSQIVERIEQINAEITDLSETRKLAFAEAKASGFDPKILRRLIAIRKRRADDVAEEEAILDLYRNALGMA